MSWHAEEVRKYTSLGYSMPCSLEVATSLLSHYALSGGVRLYANENSGGLWTYTRCSDSLSLPVPLRSDTIEYFNMETQTLTEELRSSFLTFIGSKSVYTIVEGSWRKSSSRPTLSFLSSYDLAYLDRDDDILLTTRSMTGPVVGGFESSGLDVYDCNYGSSHDDGLSCCRKF